MFKIVKKTSGFWHYFNNDSKAVNLSDFNIILDSVAQTYIIQSLNGSNIPNIAVAIADVEVIDETDASVVETFATVELLKSRLEQLNYTPYVVSGGGGSQTLAQTLVLGNETDGEDILISDGDKVLLDNGANLKKGTTDAGLGGSKGIALRCAVDYELKWEAGRLYVMEADGFTIREVRYCFTTTPTETNDNSEGFVVGSRWILDDGTIFLCTDNTGDGAVWEEQINSVEWGNVTGTLSAQTDLQTALDSKVDENAAITGATKIKITYDAKGLVTSGADATTADIADSTNKRYQTDLQQSRNDATSSIQTQLDSKSALNPRVQTVTSSATVTPTSTNDLVIITAQAAALTLANPTGTFAEGQALMIRIKDNGTARAIAFGADYRAIGITLPTTTVISKTMYLGIIYNSTDTKFDIIGLNQQA